MAISLQFSVFGLLVSVIVQASFAASCVRFDVSDVIACHDVTTDDFRAMNPDEKLVKAEIEVSAFVGYEANNDLTQFVYVIEIPEYTGRVVDYAPRTSLASDISGTVSISEQEENASSSGLNASASYDGLLSANGNVAKNEKRSKSVQFKRMPPQDLVAASGTLSRGSAAFFKVRNTTQKTLEGSQKLSLIIRVPAEWRADYLQIRCAAYSKNKKQNEENKTPICGTTRFLAGVHLAGDRDARHQAAELIRKERLLRNAAANFNQQLAENDRDELKTFFDSLLKKKKAPMVPPMWMQQVIRSRAVSRTFSFERHLPTNVREAVSAFTLAKRNLHEMSLAHANGKTTKDLSLSNQQQDQQQRWKASATTAVSTGRRQANVQ